jgi:hypothetical protein
MKTSKKLLVITMAVMLVVLISVIIGNCVFYAFGWNAWAVGILAFLAQVWSKSIWEYCMDKFVILKELQKYNAKPYKEYRIPLTCQTCGQTQPVDIDLATTTVYECRNCHRRNGIHIQFTTAANPEE